jgi:hypothetical protein
VKIQTALVGAHVRMLEALYDTVLGESAKGSVPPPRVPTFYPRS